jgi:hypothetical protein
METSTGAFSPAAKSAHRARAITPDIRFLAGAKARMECAARGGAVGERGIARFRTAPRSGRRRPFSRQSYGLAWQTQEFDARPRRGAGRAKTAKFAGNAAY